MFSGMGPVTSSPSAWRGEATNWIPKRARSNTTVPSTLTSAPVARERLAAATSRSNTAWCARTRNWNEADRASAKSRASARREAP